MIFQAILSELNCTLYQNTDVTLQTKQGRKTLPKRLLGASGHKKSELKTFGRSQQSCKLHQRHGSKQERTCRKTFRNTRVYKGSCN